MRMGVSFTTLGYLTKAAYWIEPFIASVMTFAADAAIIFSVASDKSSFKGPCYTLETMRGSLKVTLACYFYSETDVRRSTY